MEEIVVNADSRHRPATSREKAPEMFDRIARRYDLLNHLLSFNRDKAWRRAVNRFLPDRRDLKVLDLATGTGDQLLSVNDSGRLAAGIGIDPAGRMLELARSKASDAGVGDRLTFNQGEAEQLPLSDASVDVVTISFGIRNVIDVQAALREMYRVLRPGGRVLILEFSLPANWFIRTAYLLYFRHVLPVAGRWISGDREAYRYLNQTVETFPYGNEFCGMLGEAGFTEVAFEPLTFGVATIYRGEKTATERTASAAPSSPAEQVVERFDDAVRKSASTSGGGWRRINVALSDIEMQRLDLIAWLRSVGSDTRMYWLSRDSSFEAAGIGAATTIGLDEFDYQSLFSALKEQLGNMPAGTRYYGIARFDPDYPSSRVSTAWRQFGGCRFVVPLVELTRERDGLHLHGNISPDDSDYALDRCREIIHRAFAAEFEDDDDLPVIAGRSESPDHNHWGHMVNAALDGITGRQMRKVVLARRQSIDFTSPPDAVSLLTLQRLPDARGYRYLIDFDRRHAFFGTTPELLYARNGQEIETEAIAGTRPRGDNDDDDCRLAEDLLASDKDLAEHKYVADHIRCRLEELCRDISSDRECEVLKLPKLQHLYRRFAGRLHDSVDDGMIITALHPTPAVGGEPRETAIGLIRNLEPFDRGWFAGPVGWISRDAAEFAVAIRSARLQNEELTLYAGAGIVDGSEAQAEWYETAHKLHSIFAGRLE